jgi:hypothetical protein
LIFTNGTKLYQYHEVVPNNGILYIMREDMKQVSEQVDVNKQARYLKGTILGTLGFCTRWAVDVHGVGPEWIEVVEIDLPLQSRHTGLYKVVTPD